MGQEPAEGGAGAALDVGRGQALHPLAPDLDALEERAALVVARLALGEDRVEVEVRLDEGRRHQAPLGIDLERPALGQRGADAGDAVAPDSDVDRVLDPGDARAPDQEVHGAASAGTVVRAILTDEHLGVHDGLVPQVRQLSRRGSSRYAAKARSSGNVTMWTSLTSSGEPSGDTTTVRSMRPPCRAITAAACRSNARNRSSALPSHGEDGHQGHRLLPNRALSSRSTASG